MTAKEIITELKSCANPRNVEGMARFGISVKNTLGVSMITLRQMAKDLKKEKLAPEAYHQLALNLWNSGIHEARILAGLIDIPELVTEKQMDEWVADFDSWDVCDQITGNLFDRTNIIYNKIPQWVGDEREFFRRAGFASMAWLSVHDKKAPDAKFEKFFPLIKKYSTDERNFVRKAVNWALRQIGKRRANLLPLAMRTAREIEKIDSRSARWIARDALRELANYVLKK